jgi:hypothetical protein
MDTNTIQSYEGDKYYLSTDTVFDEPKPNPTMELPNIRIEYITYYSLNKPYIWSGLVFVGFIIAYYFLLFSIYLRANAYKNNLCAPFTPYDYDVNACNNAIYNMYWNEEEGFEDRGTPKKKAKGILANIQDGAFSIVDFFLIIPKSIWKIVDKIKSASENINTEIAKKTDPYYYQFTKKINRAVKKSAAPSKNE